MLGCKINLLMIDCPTKYSLARTLCLLAEQGSPVQIQPMIARLLMILRLLMLRSLLVLEQVSVLIQLLIPSPLIAAASAELHAIQEFG